MSLKYVQPEEERPVTENDTEEHFQQEAARQGMVVAAPVLPIFTYALLAAIIAVFLAQELTQNEFWLAAAGVNSRIRDGEYWRLITSGTMHAGLFHIFMNGMALYNLGSAIEYLSNRYNLAIVFLFSVAGGSALSAVLMLSDLPSIGASGGIAGLLGFITVYGFKRRKILPPSFLRDMLINVGLLVAIGVIFSRIDNAAHAGGFITGALYGLLQVHGDVSVDPRKSDPVAKLLGFACLLTYLGFAALTILLITNTITL